MCFGSSGKFAFFLRVLTILQSLLLASTGLLLAFRKWSANRRECTLRSLARIKLLSYMQWVAVSWKKPTTFTELPLHCIYFILTEIEFDSQVEYAQFNLCSPVNKFCSEYIFQWQLCYLRETQDRKKLFSQTCYSDHYSSLSFFSPKRRKACKKSNLGFKEVGGHMLPNAFLTRFQLTPLAK